MPPRATKRASATGAPIELANLPLVNGEGEESTSTVTETRRESELEETLMELGSDTRIKVWRTGADGAGKNAMCGEMSGDGFTLDLLLDTFGGGDYSLHIFQGKTLKEKVRVSLDPSVPVRNPRTARAGVATGGAPGLGDFTSIMGAMANQSTSMIQMMMGMATMQQQSTASMISAITAMMTARPEKDPMDWGLGLA